ncbi:MAG TPA: TIGR01458 family HAD-type hydrolase [Acidobacteriota bacterium]|nr:TIGR01458 family HAD-type hydrolase [Acidobacteriota bacterium]
MTALQPKARKGDCPIALAGITGLLLDLDGVFFVGRELLPGAVAALQYLRTGGIPFRFTTNTTTSSRTSLAEKIGALGLEIAPEEIVSAPFAAVLHLRQLGKPRCRLVVSDAIRETFAEFPESSDRPEAIVIGDIGSRWNYDLLNELFRQIMDGAALVALHKGRYWQEPEGLRLDIGVFVAGLEYVTGKTATVIGKPSAEFYRLAVGTLARPPQEVAMLGDDILSDVGGAQRAGLKGVLVTTGKYRPETTTASGVTPDAVLESIAHLPELFGTGT